MTNKTTFSTLALLAICLIFLSCNKDNANDEKFCNFISEQDFNGTGTLIDAYLETLKNDDPAESLDKLKGWLESKSCVSAVSILCNSCIQTLPSESELRVTFNSNGQTISRTIDIKMTDPLMFVTYHE